MNRNTNINLEINNIFATNTLTDLKRFLAKRHCLNVTNSYLVYLFHMVQSAGILTTSIAAGYQFEALIWAGVVLNVLATLIHVYEKMNESMMKQLLKDIKAIKAGTYVDERELIEIEQKSEIGSRTHRENTIV